MTIVLNSIISDMKIWSILLVLLIVLTLGCVKRTETEPSNGPQGMPPLNPPDIDPAIAGRIFLAESDFEELLSSFTDLMKEYNNHLVSDEFHPEAVEAEFFEACCVQDELEVRYPTDIPPDARLEIINIWFYGLYECCQELERQVRAHLDYFHPEFEQSDETGFAPAPYVPAEPVEVRLETVETNVRNVAGYVEYLRILYDEHLEQAH